MKSAPTWEPFLILHPDERPPLPRSVETPEGVTDRLRVVAFAELQAREAFRWAAERFEEAEPAVKTAWRGLALAEDRHLNWLLTRLKELNCDVAERGLQPDLWNSFMQCQSPREFAVFMANAEERGRRGGERLRRSLQKIDPVSAELFGRIADEEVEHIQCAERFFPGAVGSRR